VIKVPFASHSPVLRRLFQLCAGLGAVLALELLIGAVLVVTRQPPAGLTPSDSTLAAMPVKANVEPASTVAGEIVERPLFWSTRQPLLTALEEAAPGPASGRSSLDKARLLGLFSSDNSAGIIIGSEGKRERLVIGESLGDWTLEAVEANSAVFSRGGGERRRVELEYAGLK
jgi:hypothetical protein